MSSMSWLRTQIRFTRPFTVSRKQTHRVTHHLVCVNAKGRGRGRVCVCVCARARARSSGSAAQSDQDPAWSVRPTKVPLQDRVTSTGMLCGKHCLRVGHGHLRQALLNVFPVHATPYHTPHHTHTHLAHTTHTKLPHAARHSILPPPPPFPYVPHAHGRTAALAVGQVEPAQLADIAPVFGRGGCHRTRERISQTTRNQLRVFPGIS
jgi:hypothetical protein